MPVGKILWGAASSGCHYENELLLGYSIFEPVDDHPPRAGSEWVQAPSGVEDAWITGRDYELHCEARFIPDDPAGSTTVPGAVRSPLAGPNSWMQFLDYARDKNTFRLCPYSSLPDFFVDGVYLVAPTSGMGTLDETKQLRTIPLVLRNPSVPWTQALVRGVALEYAPGQPSTGTGLDGVDARPGAALYSAKSGMLVSASTNVLRERHYPPGTTTPTLLLESSAANLCIWSQDFTAWGPRGLTVSSGVDDPIGGTNAQTLTSSSAAGIHDIYQNPFAPGSTFQVGSVYVRARGWGYARVGLYSTGAAAYVAWGAFDLANGVALTTGVGRLTIERCRLASSVGVPWYRIACGASSAATADVQLHVGLAASSGGETWTPGSTSYSLDVFGAQLETGVSYRTSYIPTTGSVAASRSADSFYFPLPVGFSAPQPLWLYLKFIERGAISGPQAFAELASVCSSAVALPYVGLAVRSGYYYYANCYGATGGNGQSRISTGVALANFGDTVELLLTQTSSGYLHVHQSINAGADVDGGAAVAQPPGTSWSGARLYLNSQGSTVNIGDTEFLLVKAGPGTAISTIAAARSA